MVVLTVGVVVTALRSQDLVATQHHRSAHRKEQHAKVVLRKLLPESVHCRVGGFAFHAGVPGIIVVVAVVIVLEVLFVVLAVVGNKIVESKPVVTRNEVDAGVCRSTIVLVEVG